MKRDQKNMTKLLVGVIVALVAVLAVLVVVLVLTPSATITSHSAQAEVEAEQNDIFAKILGHGLGIADSVSYRRYW